MAERQSEAITGDRSSSSWGGARKGSGDLEDAVHHTIYPSRRKASC